MTNATNTDNYTIAMSTYNTHTHEYTETVLYRS